MSFLFFICLNLLLNSEMLPAESIPKASVASVTQTMSDSWKMTNKYLLNKQEAEWVIAGEAFWYKALVLLSPESNIQSQSWDFKVVRHFGDHLFQTIIRYILPWTGLSSLALSELPYSALIQKDNFIAKVYVRDSRGEVYGKLNIHK